MGEIGEALVKAEGLRAGRNNPHLEERRQRFLAWGAAQKAQSKVTNEELAFGLQVLGLYSPELESGGMLPRMDPVRNNAAWHVCLTRTGQAGTVPALADVENADRIAASLRPTGPGPSGRTWRR